MGDRRSRSALRARSAGSHPAKFLVKDLTFARDEAGGMSLPVLEAVRQLFVDLTADGLGDQDNSVVLELLRRRNGTAASTTVS